MLGLTLYSKGKDDLENDDTTTIDPEKEVFLLKDDQIIGRIKLVYLKGNAAKLGFEFSDDIEIKRGAILDLGTFSRVEDNLMKKGVAYDA